MTLPLTGFLVVSLEQAVAAPMASCRLADAGARVIKLERSDGDFARNYDDANGQSAYFAWLNRGKESLIVDIKRGEDQALVHRILSRADVFIQNLAVGAAARSGLGSEALRQRYPGLVTCDISGYGEHGEYAGMKAYDLLVQAESGLVSVSGAPGDYGRVGVSVCDIATGVSAALAVTEALMERERTGVAKGVKLSLFDVIADWMTVPLLQQDYTGSGPRRVGLAHPSIAPYGGFTTREGTTLVICVQNDREWRDLAAQVMEDADLAGDPRFATNKDRVARRPEVDDIVGTFFAAHTRRDLEARLRAARIAFGNVNSLTDLSTHPALRRWTVNSSTGDVSMPAHPNAALETPHTLSIPDLNEQGAAIREEFAAPTLATASGQPPKFGKGSGPSE